MDKKDSEKKDLSKTEKRVLGFSLITIGILGILLNLILPLFTEYLPNLDTTLVLSVNLLWILVGFYIMRGR